MGHVFRLTFSSRQEIGQQHRLAKAATDAFVAAFPPSWHDIPNFVDDRPNPVVTERQVLVALVSLRPGLRKNMTDLDMLAVVYDSHNQRLYLRDRSQSDQ